MSNITRQIKNKRLVSARRHARTRARISGIASRPRLSVSTSLSGIYIQFIDDLSGKTLLAGRDNNFKGTKTERAVQLGKILAEKALKLDIKEVVFDRGNKKYHGRVKALAEALRAGGLKF